MDKNVMGGGAVFIAIVLVLTEGLSWPGYINYIAAALVLVWGLVSFKG